MTPRYAVGLDLGGTHLKAAVVDDHGRVLHKMGSATRAERGVEAVLSDLAQAADVVITASEVERGDIAGVGIGAPGPLSPSRGLIYRSANLPPFQNVPIRDELARRTGLPVAFDNDGNAAALGEFWVGAGSPDASGPVRDLVLLTLGTGVGAGVILDGRLLHGHFENAGELGHTIVEPGGLPCPCGQRGCLEQYASAGAVARRMAAELHGKSGPARPGSDDDAMTCEAVADAARAGDPLATRIWDDACRYLAVACVNIQHTYNPAVVALGGGMSAAGDLLVDLVRDHLRQQRWRLADDLPRIVLAKLGNDAGVIGAAGLVLLDAWTPAGR